MPARRGSVYLPMLAAVLVAGMLNSCGFHRKYENPISKDTLQPDKILFDKAIADLEHARYDVARLTLQTLISTYDTSEFLAKAKLAIADSWFREGGGAGLANAEAEYKDFILFYPMLEEAAEAQSRVCDIHYRQMDKPDRDADQAMRADEECRNLLTQFPNSKNAPAAQQKLRNIQEVLGDSEYRIANFYYNKASLVAAANRFQGLTDHYPLFSKADEALWKQGDSYSRLGGGRLSPQAALAFARIVRDYPLSAYVDQAKKRLAALEQPIPEPDPVQLSRMKYELENREKPSMMSHFWGAFRKSPAVYTAAKSGAPATSVLRPSNPVTVPGQLPPGGAIGSDVTVSAVPDSGAAATTPDVRPTLPTGNAPNGQGTQRQPPR